MVVRIHILTSIVSRKIVICDYVCNDDGSVIDFHTEILYGDIKKIDYSMRPPRQFSVDIKCKVLQLIQDVKVTSRNGITSMCASAIGLLYTKIY